MERMKVFRTFALANQQGAIAQLVEQRTENPCVSGSIPELGIEKKIRYYGILAQLVEHLTFNQVVRGSNPRCLISFKRLRTL